MNRRLPTIAVTLRKGLLLRMLAAFLLMMTVSVFMQYRIAIHQAERLLRLTIRDVCQDIRRASNENLLQITRRVASNYETDPEVDFVNLTSLYNVSEINLVGSDGIILRSSDPSLVGFDMGSGAQASAFLPLLDGEEELVETLQPMTYNPAVLRKYAGVALSGGGFIQVGYSAAQFQSDIAEEIRGITGNRHVLETGLVFILDADLELVSVRSDLPGTRLKRMFSEGNVLGSPNKMTAVTDEGQRGYWMYDTMDGYRIVGVMAEKEALETVRVSLGMIAAMGVVLFTILMLGIGRLVKRTVVRPVDEVAGTLSEITNGNLDRRMDVRASREFDRISDEVNATVDALKAHIAREAARIDEELGYARDIQRSALPTLSKEFTEQPEFSLHAFMGTAKEVGGDFYDFYMLDRRTLAFVVADVSGKGIPAAMFMMRGKTTLRDCAERAEDIGHAMAYANDRLYEGNEAGMFITAWMGFLDIETGTVRFANAGHNPPVLIRDGRAGYLEMEADLILGIMDEGEYETQTLALQRDDVLLLYTDGVTEATNEQNELFGEARLLKALDGVKPQDDVCRTVCERVKAALKGFVGSSPQADDITMLCLQYTGRHE